MPNPVMKNKFLDFRLVQQFKKINKNQELTFMKRIIATILLVIGVVWGIAAYGATTIATVDMQKIFTTAKEVKKINANLEKKFSSRKNTLLSEQKTLQANAKKLQKNQSILKQTDLEKQREKITKEATDFREKQAKFQQDLYAAQNEAMRDFMKTLNSAVEKVAQKKSIDVVLPNNNLLYAKSNLDITKDVLKYLD
jgi:outer membrane protein